MNPAIEAVGVMVLTLVLVVTRPRGLNEGVSALLGAAAVLVLGLVSPVRAVHLEAGQWNIFLFFLGMMAVAALADQSGAFDAIAAAAASFARGRVAVLYGAIFALGAVISVLFANDTTALVLTPIVYSLVVRLALDPLPFVFVTTFIADTASVGLPVSNPLNVILAGGFGLTLGGYVGHLWLSALLVIAVNVIVFYALFRHSLGGRYRPLETGSPRPGLPSTFALLGLLATGYLIASATGFSLGLVACAGAGLLALNLWRLHVLDPGRLRREISYAIFAFIAGMVVIVQALDGTGVTAALGRGLVHLGGQSLPAADAVTTAGTALGANLINNLPMALVMTTTLPAVHVAAKVRTEMIYATVLGCDLGPNLTHLGSLATFIWLFFLRRKGVEVSPLDYFKVGVVVTPLMLVAAAVGLYLTSR